MQGNRVASKFEKGNNARLGRFRHLYRSHTRRRSPLVNGPQAPHMKGVIPRENHQTEASPHHAAAIARWEDEGGAATSSAELKVGKALAEEGKILEYLGAAVIMRWGTLPTKIQRELFEHASSLSDLGETLELKGQIARFLHNHKNDGVRTAKATLQDVT